MAKIPVDIVPRKNIKDNATIVYGGATSIEGIITMIYTMITSYPGKVNPLVPQMGCKNILDELFFSDTDELNLICSRIQEHLTNNLNANIQVGVGVLNNKVYKLRFNVYGINLESRVEERSEKNNSSMVNILPLEEIKMNEG